MAFLAALSLAGSSTAAQHSALVSLVLLAAAVGAWAFERYQTTRGAAPEDLRTLRRLLPEICGVLLALSIAGALLICRAHHQAVPPEDEQVWQQIRNEWPMLVTADSLVGLQALLRVVLLSSAALRVKEAAASPLAGSPTAFLLLAALVQVTLLAMSSPDVYHLDGPLGGNVDLALEVSALALLACVAAAQLREWKQGPSCTSTLAVLALLPVLGYAAWTNRIGLADPGDAHLDALFSLQHLLELTAALAFLGRALRSAAEGCPAGSFTAFACVMLPLQQLLAAYFLLAAWGGEPLEELPALVGAGQPFKMLQLGSVIQVGAYAAAGISQLVLVGEDAKLQQGLFIDV